MIRVEEIKHSDTYIDDDDDIVHSLNFRQSPSKKQINNHHYEDENHSPQTNVTSDSKKTSTPCHVVIFGRINPTSARAEEVSRMGSSSGTPVKGQSHGNIIHQSGIHLQQTWNYIDVQVFINKFSSVFLLH